MHNNFRRFMRYDKEIELTDNARTVLEKRYLLRDQDGNIIETPEQMFLRVAKKVAEGDLAYPNEDWTKGWTQQVFYDLMATKQFLPNTPTLVNAGRPGAPQMLSACFVLPVEDSMEAIFDSIKDAAIIHKYGGGTGFSFGRLREAGSIVSKTNGVSSGPIAFMKVFNAATEAVKQGGCFIGDTLIATPSGPIAIKDITEGTQVYSYSPNGYVISTATKSWKTKKNAEVWKLVTDKGLEIFATPDHPIMMRHGKPNQKTFTKLSDLKVGMSIMPFSRYQKTDNWMITLHDGKDTRIPEHRFICFGTESPDLAVHHIDGDHFNNHPDNLQVLTHEDHSSLHANVNYQDSLHPFKHLTKEQKEKGIAGWKKWFYGLSEEARSKYDCKVSTGLSVSNLKRISEGTHNFVNAHPSYNPKLVTKAQRSRIATTAYKLINDGISFSEDNWDDVVTRSNLYRTEKYSLSTVVSYFGSFPAFVEYLDTNNHKVVSVEFSHTEDVYNVEVLGTHNYVVCNSGMTTGVVVSNTRRGANMGILPVTHPDIEQFIHVKDDLSQMTNFNLSVALTDDFMDAVKQNSYYYLIDPKTGKPYVKDGRSVSKNARDIFNQIIKSAWSTGEPGIIFIDRVNDDDISGQVIEASNPCVIGETTILTKQGYIPIENLVDELIEVWNGYKWSTVTPKQTGQYQNILTIDFSDGTSLSCTHYHQFVLADNSRVKAIDLSVGSKLIKYTMPIIGEVATHNKEMYTKGFYAGDGSVNRNQIWLYGEKQSLVKHFSGVVNNHTVPDGRVYVDIDKSVVLEKDFVPDVKYSLSDRISWLGGLIDSDGTNNSEDGAITISSIDRTFLMNVKFMINTLGVNTTVSQFRTKSYREMPDGNGGKKEYLTQDCFRLTISASSVSRLNKIGLITHRVDSKSLDPDRDASRFIYVKNITTGETADRVYCFNEPLNHTAIFNGVMTAQCSEQFLPPYDSCTLGSINVGVFVDEESQTTDWGALEYCIRTCVHFLDNVLTINEYPLDEIKQQTMKGRRIGLGIMGFADYLVKLGIRYDSPEGLEAGTQLMRFVQYHANAMSETLAETRGACSLWDAQNYGRPRRNITTTTVAPTGTISIIAGCSSGLEPYYAIAFTRNQCGNTIMIEENDLFKKVAQKEGFYSNDLMKKIAAENSISGFDEIPKRVRNIFRTAADISPEMHIKMQAAFQEYTCNGISKTINMDSSATEKDVEDAYMLAYELGCKSVSIYRDGSRDGQVLSTGKTKTVLKIETTDYKIDPPVIVTETPVLKLSTDGLKMRTEDSFIDLESINTLGEYRPTSRDVLGAYYDPTRFNPNKFVFPILPKVPEIGTTEPLGTRPDVLPGFTSRIKTGEGTLFVTLNEKDGKPFEVFLQIGKSGWATMAHTEAIARLISMVFQNGGNIKDVIDQLQGIGGDSPLFQGGTLIKSLPDAIAKVLSHYKPMVFVPTGPTIYGKKTTSNDLFTASCDVVLGEKLDEKFGEKSGKKCPECNSVMIPGSGCATCPDCGYSKCS